MTTSVLIRSAYLHGHELRANPALAVIGLVQPAAVQTLLLSTHRVDDPTALVAGSCLMTLWTATVWSSGMLLRREIRLGTIAGLLTRPTDLRWIVAGKALGASTAALLLNLLVAAVLPPALGYHLHVARPALLPLAAVLALASATAVGTLLAGLFISSRAAGRIAEALLFPVFLLSGALLPISRLPTWLHWPSALLDLRWLREITLAAMNGSDLPSHAVTILLACTAVQYATAHAVFGRLLQRARKEATLDYY
ncbi:ABC transporter permease [Streptomyces sp. NPDC046915]|uniref:ABC transporter permease n=1 Tax=Streptomyces sp. NPDC046915 TaxID=3155257 RepID=UPI0033DE57C2